MPEKRYLDNKKVLIVDDEPDIVETLIMLLPMCDIDTAFTFDEAWDKLGSKFYDLAILDIMGVNGYRLLSLANEQEITAVMLTAHALTPEDAKKSFEGGAAFYIPKDEMVNIETYLNDVLEEKEKGRNPQRKWFDRFVNFFNRRFGPGWQEKDKEFWNKDIFY
jgi:CheY-like chemotaxis protein